MLKCLLGMSGRAVISCISYKCGTSGHIESTYKDFRPVQEEKAFSPMLITVPGIVVQTGFNTNFVRIANLGGTELQMQAFVRFAVGSNGATLRV